MSDDYDHLVPFDEGLLESGQELYLFGFIHPVVSDDSKLQNEIKGVKMGPIVEWWFTGFDRDDSIQIGIDTCYASYFLRNPHVSYKRFVDRLMDKLNLCKIIIEFLDEFPEANYNDLIDVIQVRSKYQYSDESLMKNANFIVQQIISYDDESGDDDERKLLETFAIKEFMNLCGVNSSSSKKSNKNVKCGRRDKRRLCNSDSLSVTTLMVRSFFSEIFQRTFENRANGSKTNHVLKREITRHSNPRNVRKIEWISEQVFHDIYSGRSHYSKLSFGSFDVSIGDYVKFSLKNNISFGQIKWMFEMNRKKIMHLVILKDGSQTIIGATAPAKQLFLTKGCCDVDALHVLSKIQVMTSSKSDKRSVLNPGISRFYCDKFYCQKTGWFRDLDPKFLSSDGHCFNCTNQSSHQTKNNLSSDQLVIDGCSYSIGDYVLLSPEAYDVRDYLQEYFDSQKVAVDTSYDDKVFTEKYRKSYSEDFKGSFGSSCSLFKIGVIQNLIANDQLEIRKLFRPQNYFKNFQEIIEADVREMFDSDETCVIQSCHVRKKLYSVQKSSVKTLSEPHFIIRRKLDTESQNLSALDTILLLSLEDISKQEEKEPLIPLRMLDIFSGCGGFAYGFNETGICKTSWAIEKDVNAASAFQKNFPSAVMFVNDANQILKEILSGKLRSESSGLRLPQKGEVEVILAGPPCQGFSEMNRFSSGSYSLFKNSLIATLLSFVDHFRPKYVYIENVRNFFKFSRGMIFKLTLSCLIHMGYQVGFSVLQAGCYGVSQSRNRAFIFAAASGRQLAELPPVLTSFPHHFYQNSLLVDSKKFTINRDKPVAYYRQITVSDVTSDLPSAATSGNPDTDICYDKNPQTSFQKRMREKMRGSDSVKDHVSRPLSQLNLARVERIPFTRGSDWRDLPNLELKLPSGLEIRRLEYLFRDSETGRLSGVCRCSEGNVDECEGQTFRQENTLIPWCLAHTASRNYQWSGLYGRLQWDEFFSTVVTIPEPSSKQGRVIHPTSSRVLTIRESSRAQGFPDHFQFSGSISDRYRQVSQGLVRISYCMDE